MARVHRLAVNGGETALEFERVSRRFLIRHEQRSSFQDWFIGLIRPRGRAEEFWALRDVSFSVRRGEAIGILGRNGAGKSTLLKLVTRILEPSGGTVRTYGRVHAMLELGAGFHPELSGRDNVFLNGSIYGFSRRQMLERFPSIVAFAELERFIDTPIKHYSSGMFMRLGFAIAIHMDPEILVIDEVLAVGDASFQRKSYEALQRLKASGTTILFVSHSAEQVRTFCDRAALLHQGQLIDFGPVGPVVDHYLRLLQEETPEASLVDLQVTDATGRPIESLEPGQDLGAEVLLRCRSVPADQPIQLSIDLHDRRGTHLFGSSAELPHDLPLVGPGDPSLRRVLATIRGLPIASGPLHVSASLQRTGPGGLETLDRRETRIDVVGEDHGERGILRLEHAWDWGEASVASPPAAGAVVEVGRQNR